MTEKKQLPEQTAFHDYKRPITSRAADVPVSRSARSERKQPREEAVVLQRVVSVPEADPSNAWNTFAERQERLRRARARPQRYVEAAPRTFAQTGAWASSGRIKAVRRTLNHSSSPIPTRSGRMARRRSIFWKLLGLFAISAVLVLALNFALTGGAFRVSQVNVEGTHNAALEQAIQHMGIQGQNVFLINIPELKARIEAIPVVATADLSRQLPNQLVITLSERVPTLLWQTPKGVFSVDNKGVVIAAQKDTPGSENLSIVLDISKTGDKQQQAMQMQPGMHLNQANIDFARTLFNRLPGVLGNNAFKLQYDGTIYASVGGGGKGASRGASYIVESSAGWKAFLGDANDTNPLENRLIALQQILALAHQRQYTLATIDLRYGLRPVYTLK